MCLHALQEVRLFAQPRRFPTDLFRQLLRCLEVAACQLVGLAATLEASADLAVPQLAAGQRSGGGASQPLRRQPRRHSASGRCAQAGQAGSDWGPKVLPILRPHPLRTCLSGCCRRRRCLLPFAPCGCAPLQAELLEASRQLAAMLRLLSQLARSEERHAPAGARRAAQVVQQQEERGATLAGCVGWRPT
jgi:hypothetical protein